MRMWMTNPGLMCSKHLRGEYHELFAILGILRKKRSIAGYIKNNLIEPQALKERYLVLRFEMLRRHFKPEAFFDYSDSLLDYLPDAYRLYRINREESLKILLKRCPNCRERYMEDLWGASKLI